MCYAVGLPLMMDFTSLVDTFMVKTCSLRRAVMTFHTVLIHLSNSLLLCSGSVKYPLDVM